MARKFDHQRICDLYVSGMSIPQICKEIGCTSGCVIPALKKAGIQTRSLSDAVHMAKAGRIYNWGKGYQGICAEKNKRMPYHRYLMEQTLGRKLLRTEHVHHIDGNKENNSLENLVVMSKAEHAKLHHRQGDIR